MFDPYQLLNAVEKHRDLIFNAEAWLWKHPETGFREWKSHAYLKNEFEKLGYTLREAGNIPGFTADIDTGLPGPRILILGELDSLICADHPDADPETHAVHSCGHHAQCAALLGIAAALKEPGILDGLSGSVRLCAVPAEELIETGYRETLRAQGVIKYMGGKVEFMHRGYFDDVDMAFMLHTSGGDHDFVVTRGCNGCVVKNIYYQGRAVHASGAYDGVNALYAANLGMQAINALRETFRDEDHVRWHPIMTSGGDMVNNIPETAKIESMLRAVTTEALERENEKINRALIGAAISFGVEIEITDEPGYAPLLHDKNLAAAAKEAFDKIIPFTDTPSLGCGESFDGVGGGTMDMGDLAMLMPIIHPYMGGSVGKGHGNDYYITDPVTACVTNAMWQVALIKTLLENGGERAKLIAESYTPTYKTKEEFLSYQDLVRKSGSRVEYLENGEILIK